MKLLDMSDLKNLLSKLTKNINKKISQSDQIKDYINKMNASLDLIKRCFVILVFLAGFIVFMTEWL